MLNVKTQFDNVQSKSVGKSPDAPDFFFYLYTWSKYLSCSYVKAVCIERKCLESSVNICSLVRVFVHRCNKVGEISFTILWQQSKRKAKKVKIGKPSRATAWLDVETSDWWLVIFSISFGLRLFYPSVATAAAALNKVLLSNLILLHLFLASEQADAITHRHKHTDTHIHL